MVPLRLFNVRRWTDVDDSQCHTGRSNATRWYLYARVPGLHCTEKPARLFRRNYRQRRTRAGGLSGWLHGRMCSERAKLEQQKRRDRAAKQRQAYVRRKRFEPAAYPNADANANSDADTDAHANTYAHA